MNPEQFLTKVSQLLSKKSPVPSGLYVLYLEDHQPLLTCYGFKPTPQYVLAILRSGDINVGITSKMWTQIKDRYAIFTKRGAK